MRTTLALTVAAGLATTVAAQDSVSNSAVFAQGDAPNPYATNEQVADYVVDLAPLTTSWGTEFGVAPLIKSPKTSGAFFTGFLSSQAISKDLLTGVPAAAPDYAVWNMAGQGVNPNTNDGAGSVALSGPSTQFAVAFNTFDPANNGGNVAESTLAGLVNFDPADPARLYVRRTVAAVANANDVVGNTAALGGVSIDANGNLYVRADDFGVSGAPAVSANNILRVQTASRNASALNIISGGFGSIDATDVLVNSSGIVHNPANNIPASVAGGNGVAVGSTAFAGSEYYFGAAGVAFSTAHLGPNSDHRGTVATTTATPLGGDYTMAMLQQSSGDTESIGVWATDTAGNVLLPTRVDLDLPVTISDPTNTFSIATVNGGGAATLDGYRSQANFEGGVGSVAVHQDQNGDLLAAGTLYMNGGISQDPANAIVVARRDATGAVSWVSVANSASNGGAAPKTGKDILDGPGGNPIGQLTTLFDVTGGTPAGPSISQPAFDSVGNVWFLAAASLNKVDGMGVPFIDTDTVLIRAVYNPTSFSYDLELVLELGDVFNGQNSGLEYQIGFLRVADGNSIASDTIFSSNVSSRSWNNTPIANLDTADPRTNGGVVISADITYDKDLDGDFEDPTGGTMPMSDDESYQVLLYVGNTTPAGPMGCNPADLAAPFGQLTFGDISAFLGAFDAMDPAADLAAPFGQFTFGDISAFLAAFDAGCP
jgi:hypothetical protein